jgi:O-antigen/teichoic acid export membrane protein
MVNIRNTALFSVRLLLVSAFPIIIFMLIFPSFLMSLFGDDFKQGALILQVLVLGQAVNVITGSVGYLLLMSGNERDLRFVTIFSGITVVVITCTLTQHFAPIEVHSDILSIGVIMKHRCQLNHARSFY